MRVLGSGERFFAEADWGSASNALVAPPTGKKCKRVRVRRWYLSIRSGPSAIESAAFVDDQLVKPFTIPEGSRNAVIKKLRHELSDSLQVPVLGLWMFPTPG